MLIWLIKLVNYYEIRVCKSRNNISVCRNCIIWSESSRYFLFLALFLRDAPQYCYVTMSSEWSCYLTFFHVQSIEVCCSMLSHVVLCTVYTGVLFHVISCCSMYSLYRCAAPCYLTLFYVQSIEVCCSMLSHVVLWSVYRGVLLHVISRCSMYSL
jgi:hypothetical protein